MTYNKKVKEEILSKGLEIFKQDPARLNHNNLAKELRISNAKIHYHFGKDLKSSVINYGIEKQDSHLIVQLYASGYEIVKSMSQSEIKKHQDVVFKSI